MSVIIITLLNYKLNLIGLKSINLRRNKRVFYDHTFHQTFFWSRFFRILHWSKDCL